MSEPSINFTIEPPIKKIEHTVTLDNRTFEPCKPKEIVEWSWRKFKNEKWIVHLGFDGKLKKWKLTDPEDTHSK